MRGSRQGKEKNEGARSTDVSVVRNVLCVTKVLFHTYPKTLWVTMLYVVCRVLVPFLGTLIPAVAIAGIMEGEPKRFFAVMAAVLLLSLAVGICSDISRQYLLDCRVFTRFQVFLSDYVSNVLKADYEKVEPADRQKEISLGAKAVIGGNWGIEKLMTESVEFLVQMFGLLTYAAAVLTLDWRILLVLLCTFLLDFVLRGHAVRYYQRHHVELSEANRRLNYLEEISLDHGAGKDIRVYAMDGWFRSLFAKLHADAVDFQRRAEFRFYIPAFGNQFCVAGQEILAYFVLVGLVLSGDITVAEFTLQLGMVRGFTNWIFGVAGSFGALKKANGETNDYRSVLEMTKPERSGAKPAPKVTSGPEIEFRDVSFRYPNSEEDVLSHVNARLRIGEKTAIVGRNGAGKTTFIKLLCRLYDPTQGEFLLNGINIRYFDYQEYLSLFSVVFQDFRLLSASIAENVAASAEYEEEKIVSCIRQAGLGARPGLRI